jgi:hypothetical protein
MTYTVTERLELLARLCEREVVRLSRLRDTHESAYERARAIGGIEAYQRVAEMVDGALEAAHGA